MAHKHTAAEDIVQLILEDHKPLKKLIKIMKDTDKDLEERKAAFEQFAPLLVTHAKPEEQSLYVYMKKDEDTREEALEGDVEHGLADQMLEEAKRTDDEDLWTARVKVLAELVEHHIEEEEEELLPEFKKNSEPEERRKLGHIFLRLKDKIEVEEAVQEVEDEMAAHAPH
ncbi:MAG: hemerythrin domain-containing protein [Bdellovibrionaceae bacterium]|nr:hemerythrin domain-containing protein [Pseudobdellovibrionaceae bacterium]MBX3035057.1 hemerythrin domain-containing protein [Pseudobdellovibrionaceae bacterium]